MNDRQRIRNATRDVTPCKDCPERFLACSDKCPKDERGEYGYKAWKAEIRRVKKNKQDYLRREAVRKPCFYTYDEEG